jgi:hypothetical protein
MMKYSVAMTMSAKMNTVAHSAPPTLRFQRNATADSLGVEETITNRTETTERTQLAKYIKTDLSAGVTASRRRSTLTLSRLVVDREHVLAESVDDSSGRGGVEEAHLGTEDTVKQPVPQLSTGVERTEVVPSTSNRDGEEIDRRNGHVDE